MEFISSFIDQWLGTALPRLFLLFLGVLLVILVASALWDRRINKLGGLLGVLTGLFMASIALEESIARFVGSLDPAFRIRAAAVMISLSLLFLTASAWTRTGLHRRYGLAWTAVSLIVLLTALFPGLLRSFPSLIGVHYALVIAGLFIVFLLLLVFYFSIAISELQAGQQVLLQRLSQLEAGERAEGASRKEAARAQDTFREKFRRQVVIRRPARGTVLGAPLIILIASLSVFWVGMSAPQVMIGDEVTHYYMLENQARVLPQPNFKAKIPTGWGATEARLYPHSFGWHYLGAVLFRLTGGSFAAVQLYQAFFLGQFLWAAYLLARSRGGVQTRAALPYLLILASIPMTLIFSVAFYQDVPMAAQVLTAFWLLRNERWQLAVLFMGLALLVKVNAMLFLPAFFGCLFVWTARRNDLARAAARLCCSLLLISLCAWGIGKAIEVHAGAEFYPVQKIRQIVRAVQERTVSGDRKNASPTQKSPTAAAKASGGPAAVRGSTPEEQAKAVSERHASLIANHPGDLRIKANYVVYGGLLLWLLLAAAMAAALLQRLGLLRHNAVAADMDRSRWLWTVGLSYTILAALFLKSSPDARFFLPGLPFLLLPLAEQAVCLPRPKWFIALLASLAILQGGYVLAKTRNLRRVSPELKEAIVWLQEHPVVPRKIFMYPEGSYRLFPNPHEWYMNYHLRSFWRADNDLRIAILREFKVGAVVVKKHLVASVDKDITNLGVYPDYFVKEMQQDRRFRRLFENSAVLVLQVPEAEGALP